MTRTYRTEAAIIEALTLLTIAADPRYTPFQARSRVRDFLAMLAASGAPGAVYPTGRGDLYVERA